MPSSFESDYPAITRWIKESGHIEIGGSSFADPFVKAVNRDGLLWGGRREYTTIDEALRDLEAGIVRVYWACGDCSDGYTDLASTDQAAGCLRKRLSSF